MFPWNNAVDTKPTPGKPVIGKVRWAEGSLDLQIVYWALYPAFGTSEMGGGFVVARPKKNNKIELISVHVEEWKEFEI